jgi:hypothetical protein
VLHVIFLNSGEIWYYRSFLNYMEQCKLVKYELLMAVTMKCTTFWNGMPCSPVRVHQHFCGTYCLRHQSQRVSQLVALFLVPTSSLWTPFLIYISVKFYTHSLHSLYCLLLHPTIGFAYFYMKMGTVHSSKTLQHFSWSTWYHIPQNSILECKFEP